MGHLSGEREWIVDDLDLSGNDSPQEQEADRFAASALLPEDFDLHITKNLKSKEVVAYARHHGIHPAIVAGRIQHARKDYRTFSHLVGRGQVRKHFSVPGAGWNKKEHLWIRTLEWWKTMELNNLKRFAQDMRRDLLSLMKARIEYVLSHDDEYLRAHSAEKKRIQELEKSKGRETLAEEAAYLWFNRLAAFRYMDSRGYTSPRVISPRSGESQPELLAEIKRGNIPLELKPYAADIEGFLSGRIHSSQPDREAYKLALLGTCNAWAERMPWLFTKVDDWAGLLLPQDLLSENSIIARMVSGLSDADCKEGVEIIGWLYQFYISEKKGRSFRPP